MKKSTNLESLKNNVIENLFDDSIARKTETDIKPDSVLFKNWNIGNLDIKNHFYFQNLIQECNNSGKNDQFLDFNFYENICLSDVGMIFTGGVFDGIFTKLNNLYYDKDESEKLKKYNEFTSRIHSTGSKIFLTIKPEIGRGYSKKYFGKNIGFSASFNRAYDDEGQMCFRISDGKCSDIVDTICDIAEFADKSKFDGVLIDCTEYNILGEMASNEFNRRIFGYYSNHNELCLKVLKNLKENNNNQIVFMKITLMSFIAEVYEKEFSKVSSLKFIKTKLKQDNIIDKLSKFAKEGVDGFIFEFGTYETEFLSAFNEFEKNYLFKEIYEYIKNELTKLNIKNKFNSDLVILYKDNFSSLVSAESLVKNNIINGIDVTRNIISDVNYIKNKKVQKYSKNCIKCCFCDHISQKYNKLQCLINPSLNYSENKISIFDNKKIAVVGSGLSGLIVSQILVDRGYYVDLFDEKKDLDMIGKNCTIWGFDSKYAKLLSYFEEKVKEFAENNKINIYLNHRFQAENSNLKNYSTIVVATGFHEKFLNVNGAILKNVKSLYDCLSQRKFSDNKNNIVVYAKTELSLKFALYLLSQKKKVTLLINDLSIFAGLPNSKKTYYYFILKKLRAKIVLLKKIKKIEEDSVELIVNKKNLKYSLVDYVFNPKITNCNSYIAQSKSFDHDLFVYEPELYPNNKLFYDLVKNNFTGELFMVGNALEISSLDEIIKMAYFVGNNI